MPRSRDDEVCSAWPSMSKCMLRILPQHFFPIFDCLERRTFRFLQGTDALFEVLEDTDGSEIEVRLSAQPGSDDRPHHVTRPADNTLQETAAKGQAMIEDVRVRCQKSPDVGVRREGAR